MQGTSRNPLTREDTLLGICQAVGDDFGFNPLYLRIALSVSLLWNPTAVMVGYLGLGIAVLISRLVAPHPKAARNIVARETEPAAAAQAAKANNDEAGDLAVAA